MDAVEEQLLAYNARDLERFIAAYSVDVVFEDGENNVLMRGHEPMRERYGALFRANPELHCGILNRIRIGKYVVDEEEITGRDSLPPMHAAVIYRLEEDKIVHVRVLR